MEASVDDKVCEAVLALLAARFPGGSVCPSEVARAITDGPNWRSTMPTVHAAIDGMLAKNLVQLSWKGEPLPLRKGPYRVSTAI
ncbi:DUF3253 domain-containing protein [Sphingopyxis sp. Root1497]|uniref:DUF3253 domain-containing protein n=1 Tax=Sphingopyxis sp. Root1497 TaxID=1736474 RepID=UPI001910EEB5|nr:DUF3253 domain-containing protein [Sphingopyxis sp. Root1497]